MTASGLAGARIPRAAIDHIRRALPATHELGGRVDPATGAVTMAAGEPCLGPRGEQLRRCAVALLPGGGGGVPFHTHPRANRPSSTDFGLAHRPQALFTPLGVWVYHRDAAPTDALTAAKLRFLGHYYEPDTQAGDVGAYVSRVRALGVRAAFHPYESIGPAGVVVV